MKITRFYPLIVTLTLTCELSSHSVNQNLFLSEDALRPSQYFFSQIGTKFVSSWVEPVLSRGSSLTLYHWATMILVYQDIFNVMLKMAKSSLMPLNDLLYFTQTFKTKPKFLVRHQYCLANYINSQLRAR